jgi:hypothetical protein
VGRTCLSLLAVAALAVAGCGGSDDAGSSSTTAAATTATTSTHRPPPRKPPPAVEPTSCPPDAGNCRSASGSIVYVERVDPDGDGDAHFVLLSSEGVTAPGISVIDVKRSLRPHPLPGPGDEISAAGPVYRGSYGQSQIHARELHVARR